MTILGIEVEERFSRLAKSIVGDADITFRFEGNAYYCEQKGSSFLINFASPPPSVDEAYVKSLEGFLDHEVAHALFTDYKVLAGIPKRVKTVFDSSSPTPIVQSLQNLVEDYRIERAIINRYRGSKAHIDFMNEQLHKDLHSKDNPPESRWVGLQLALHFAIYGENPPSYLSKFTKEVHQKAGDLILDAKECSSTSRSLAIAIELYKRLNEEEEDDSEDPDEDKDSDNPSGDQNKSEGSSGSGEGSKVQTDGETLGEDWKYGLVKPKPQDRKPEKTDKFFSSPAERGPDFPRPFSRDKDRIVKNESLAINTPPKNPGVNFAAMRLASLFKAEKLTSFERGTTRGKVCSASLYRINTDSQIFKRRVNPEVVTDVCFCFGIDNSESMNISDAENIVYSIFDLLGKLDVPFMVFTYTTDHTYDNSKDGYIYDLSFTRTLPLVINLLKDFSDNAAVRRSKLKIERGSYTPTPEAFEFALAQLKNRPEKHKVFINLTDGLPQENVLPRTAFYYYHMMRNLMAEFKKRGMEYVNVGYKMHEAFNVIDPEALFVTEKDCVQKLTDTISAKVRRKKKIS